MSPVFLLSLSWRTSMLSLSPTFPPIIWKGTVFSSTFWLKMHLVCVGLCSLMDSFSLCWMMEPCQIWSLVLFVLAEPLLFHLSLWASMWWRMLMPWRAGIDSSTKPHCQRQTLRPSWATSWQGCVDINRKKGQKCLQENTGYPQLFLMVLASPPAMAISK